MGSSGILNSSDNTLSSGKDASTRIQNYIENFFLPEEADSFKIQLSLLGYDSTWTISTNIEVPDTVLTKEIKTGKPAFTMDLFNLGFHLGNSAVTPEWYNNYFQPSSVYLDEEDKIDFLNPFEDRWQISPIAHLQLGFNVKNFGLLVRPELTGGAYIPSSLLNFFLNGIWAIQKRYYII